MRSSVPALVLCSAILMACSDPTTPEAFDVEPAFAKVPTHSITGGGRVAYSDPGVPEGYTEVQTISARSRPDGSADGHVESHWPAPSDVKFHGAVDCLRVDAKVATVGFTITRSDNPNFPEGTRWVVRVKDGGKQDAISWYVRFHPSSTSTCQTPAVVAWFNANSPWYALTNGNFTVK
jgi:hypothetical protein